MAKKKLKRKITLKKAGELCNSIWDKEINKITHLKIEGKINANDFATMRDEMHALAHINLKNCDIEAIDGCGADKIPDFAFTHDLGKNIYGGNEYEAKHWLKGIILPESATTIGKRAFCYSKKLEYIELPTNLLHIEDGAFYACGKLNRFLDFPKSLKTIGKQAFQYCLTLDYDLILPDGLTSIGKSAFQNCHKVTKIKLPKSNCKIGEYAFCACTRICSDIVIPDGCKKINPLAFCSCEHIPSIEIPTTCQEIGAEAFGDAYRLTKIILHATTPPKLGKDTFINREVQTDVFVPEGCCEAYKKSEWGTKFRFITEHTRTIELAEANTLDQITTDNDKMWRQRLVLKGRMGEKDFHTLRTKFRALTHIDLRACTIDGNRLPANAFLGYNTLVEVLLPNNIQTIEESAFSGCRTLRKLHFTKALHEVKAMAFDGCCHLSEVTFVTTAPPTFGLDVFSSVSSCDVVVPNGCTESYYEAINPDLDTTFIHMIEQ